MKYVFIKIEELNGEFGYYHKTVEQVPEGTDPDEFAQDYLRNFYEGAKPGEDGDYWIEDIIIWLDEVIEIPKEHYDILKQYI